MSGGKLEDHTMLTPALELAKNNRQHGLPEQLQWAHIELQVTDIGRSVCFWTTTLGLVERGTSADGGVALGTRNKTLVVLRPGARGPVVSGHAGMYHVALGVPSQQQFSRYLARLYDAKVRLSAVDHTMSKAIYFNDPDGHGIEISYETPERFSVFVDMPHGFGVVDSQGQLRSGRDPLDVDDELRHVGSTELYGAFSDQGFLAHLHLHVPAIESAIDYFEHLGFVKNLHLSRIGFADLATGGDYTHRLAVNIWQGSGVTPAPSTAAKLMGYTLHTTDDTVFSTARSLLTEDAQTGELVGIDPTGATLRLRSSLKQEKAA
jgi:catechol 2,3-dioxygenase